MSDYIEDRLLLLEKIMDKLLEQHGLRISESKCTNGGCYEGYWQDGDPCAQCGGLGRIIELVSMKEKEKEKELWMCWEAPAVALVPCMALVEGDVMEHVEGCKICQEAYGKLIRRMRGEE